MQDLGTSLQPEHFLDTEPTRIDEQHWNATGCYVRHQFVARQLAHHAEHLALHSREAEEQAQVTHLRIEHIIGVIIYAQMQLDATILWSYVRSELLVVVKLFLHLRTQFIASNVDGIRHLNVAFDGKVTGIRVSVAVVEVSRVHDLITPFPRVIVGAGVRMRRSHAVAVVVLAAEVLELELVGTLEATTTYTASSTHWYIWTRRRSFTASS